MDLHQEKYFKINEKILTHFHKRKDLCQKFVKEKFSDLSFLKCIATFCYSIGLPISKKLFDQMDHDEWEMIAHQVKTEVLYLDENSIYQLLNHFLNELEEWLHHQDSHPFTFSDKDFEKLKASFQLLNQQPAEHLALLSEILPEKQFSQILHQLNESLSQEVTLYLYRLKRVPLEAKRRSAKNVLYKIGPQLNETHAQKLTKNNSKESDELSYLYSLEHYLLENLKTRSPKISEQLLKHMNSPSISS